MERGARNLLQAPPTVPECVVMPLKGNTGAGGAAGRQVVRGRQTRTEHSSPPWPPSTSASSSRCRHSPSSLLPQALPPLLINTTSRQYTSTTICQSIYAGHHDHSRWDATVPQWKHTKWQRSLEAGRMRLDIFFPPHCSRQSW